MRMIKKWNLIFKSVYKYFIYSRNIVICITIGLIVVLVAGLVVSKYLK